jgi:hypothetical protein
MDIRRRRSKPARMKRALRKKAKRSGAAKTLQGAGMAGQAAGRSGKAMVAYTGRKAAGKRTPLLVGVPALVGASIAGALAVRKMRQGAKQTLPDP